MTSGEIGFMVIVAFLALGCILTVWDRYRDYKAKKDYQKTISKTPAPRPMTIIYCGCVTKSVDRNRAGIYCKTCKKPIKL